MQPGHVTRMNPPYPTLPYPIVNQCITFSRLGINHVWLSMLLVVSLIIPDPRSVSHTPSLTE